MARILIVDDSLVARKILCNIVMALGHTVVGESSNGVQAFKDYARLRPDIVTMDLTMDTSDGAQATSKIIASFPEARIVVVSARQGSQVIFDLLERGARHFILKPISQEKVSVVLNNVLQQTFDKQSQLELVHQLKEKENGYLEKKWGTDVPKFTKQQHARVLIVDDSAVARKSLMKIVTELGHVIVGEAANGAQAFIEYTKLKPDVVTMDLTMAGMGGAEAISKIIAAYPTARIIVISAMEVRRGIIDALERGARHFIIKPIRQETVAAVLSNVLQQEVDLKKHREYVRKLKEADNALSLIEQEANKFSPPYEISVQDNHLVYVVINQSLTLNSCQTLLGEIEEHLNDTSRLLLDFGTILKLDQKIVFKLGELILNVENNSGIVKAISHNKSFVDFVNTIQTENKANVLADILRYFEN